MKRGYFEERKTYNCRQEKERGWVCVCVCVYSVQCYRNGDEVGKKNFVFLGGDSLWESEMILSLSLYRHNP